MTIKRMITQFRFWMFLGKGDKRAEYARKKGIFAEVGENSYVPMTLPLYPQLVRIHDNVIIHRTVQMVTHDCVNGFLMKMRLENPYQFMHAESLNPIEIMDNVYIGMNTIILGNVRIGPNAIINAGSLVASDVPPNSIVGGVPAKVIGSFDKYAKLRAIMDRTTPFEFKRSGRESIDQKTAEMAWQNFDKKKRNKTDK